MIWTSAGTTRVSIRIVTLSDSSAFVQPLQTAMSTALTDLATA